MSDLLAEINSLETGDVVLVDNELWQIRDEPYIDSLDDYVPIIKLTDSYGDDSQEGSKFEGYVRLGNIKDLTNIFIDKLSKA